MMNQKKKKRIAQEKIREGWGLIIRDNKNYNPRKKQSRNELFSFSCFLEKKINYLPEGIPSERKRKGEEEAKESVVSW